MFYREAGQYKTSYQADQALFPIRQDQIGIVLILAVAFILVPLMASNFVIDSVLMPVLIFSLAAIGLNLLTGYTGLLSLGTGGFMGVGAFACYKLATFFPGINIIVLIVCSGFLAAAAGIVFGLPSLRIKGFYLAVATLASQFFLSWCFIRIPWLYNYNISASIEVPTRTLFGIPITGPNATPVTRYLIVLTIVAVMTWLASNLIRGRIGRTWMAVRDMDIAAELIGIKLYPTKLLAFAVSSFYCGVAGAMLVFLWLGNAEVRELQHQSVVPHSVHGDHRRPRQPARLVFRRRLDLRPADRAAHDQGCVGPFNDLRDPRAHQLHNAGNAHHFLPDRGAGRFGQALADRKAETQGVAFPVLKGHTWANSPIRGVRTGQGVPLLIEGRT